MELEKEYRIAGELKVIKNILINLEYFGRLHPLIKSVKKNQNNSTEGDEYSITERPYNWIPINISYSAKVKALENIIEYEITGIPLTKATIRYVLNQIEPQEAQILFRLNLEGKLIGKKILQYKMLTAQNQFMEILAKELFKLSTKY